MFKLLSLLDIPMRLLLKEESLMMIKRRSWIKRRR